MTDLRLPRAASDAGVARAAAPARASRARRAATATATATTMTIVLPCAVLLLVAGCGGASAPAGASASASASAGPAAGSGSASGSASAGAAANRGDGRAAAGTSDAARDAAGVSALPARELELSEAAQREAGLIIDTLRGVPRAQVVQATGQLVPSEEATWRVGALVDGRVTTVLVSVGDRVSRGQVLARVHSHEVHEARAAYQLAKDELERRRMLADQAQRVRDRTQRLFDLKAASREQMETADTEFRTAAIGIENARTELDKARIHITEFLDLSLADLDHPSAAHGAGPDDADLVPIKAPAAGTVMERLATPGTVVSPGAQMFTVASLSSLWMAAAVNEADLSRLKVGQSAHVTVKAYPGEAFAGRVIKLGDALDAATRTLQVRIALPNPDGRLKPEMFATATIAGGAPGAGPRGDSGANSNSSVRAGRNGSASDSENGAPRRDRDTSSPRGASGSADDGADNSDAAIFVPQAAIQDVRGESIVFVRTAATRFAVRTVTLGATGAGTREVLTGLRTGDAIVTRGAFTLKTELLKSTLE